MLKKNVNRGQKLLLFHLNSYFFPTFFLLFGVQSSYFSPTFLDHATMRPVTIALDVTQPFRNLSLST